MNAPTTTTTTPHYVGEVAYFDTIGFGLVPCKAVDSDGRNVQIRITATRGAYHRGEKMVTTGYKVPPRSSVFVRSGIYHIRNDYHWEAS